MMHEVVGNKKNKKKNTNIFQCLLPPMKITEDQVAYCHVACAILFRPYTFQIHEIVSKPPDTFSENISVLKQ